MDGSERETGRHLVVRRVLSFVHSSGLYMREKLGMPTNCFEGEAGFGT
jgi:hypothetical protein